MKASSRFLILILFNCFIAAIIFPMKAIAQYGIKIGTTVSNFYYSGSPTPHKDYDVDLRPFLGNDIELVQTRPQKALSSLYLSIYRTFHLTQKLGLRPELTFTQKGVSFKQLDYEKIIYKVRINYIEIPLSITYQYRQKENSAGDISFGAYGAYRLGAVKKVSSHELPVTRTKVNSVKNLEGGLCTGINFRHKLSNHFWLIDFRIFLGLSDIFTSPDDWTDIYFETQKTKITGINLSVGYEF